MSKKYNFDRCSSMKNYLSVFSFIFYLMAIIISFKNGRYFFSYEIPSFSLVFFLFFLILGVTFTILKMTIERVCTDIKDNLRNIEENTEN